MIEMKWQKINKANSERQLSSQFLNTKVMRQEKIIRTKQTTQLMALEQKT